jgi:tetratricopeptide (TPR) repeat protein
MDLWKHAIQVTKNNYMAHQSFGLALFDEGRIREAIDQYNTAISIKPDYAFAFNNRGIANYFIGQGQGAFDDFNEAIRLKPDYGNTFNNRASVYLAQGNLELGCADARKACSLGSCKTLIWTKNHGICR